MKPMSGFTRRTATVEPRSRAFSGSPAALRPAYGVLLLALAVVAIPRAHSQEIDSTPLAPPDTSSPRATLKSFRTNMEQAFRAYYEEREFRFPDSVAATIRAVACLDSSQLPPVRVKRLATETALILNDVLDRVPLPPDDEIPDAQTMAELPSNVPRVWRIPGTEIEIARVMAGRGAGKYLFSSRTVARAREFYELARDLSYRPGAMDGLYERIVHEPGPWISGPWFRALPDWAKRIVVGQSLWKWIAMVATACVWLLLVYLADRFTRPKGGEPRYWLRFFLAVALLPVTLAIRRFYEFQLVVVGPAYVAVDNIIVILFFVIGAVAILKFGAAIAATIIA